MIRPVRSFQPSLVELDKRTLLSAGHVGHVAGGSPGAVMSMATQFHYYLNVKNANGQDLPAGVVMWALVSNNSTDQGRIIDKGDIKEPLKDGKIKLLIAGPSDHSLGDTFTLKLGGHVVKGIQASSSSTGQPSFIPTYILDATLLRRRVC